MHVAQRIFRGDEELVSMVIRLVCMSSGAKAARIPAELREQFKDYVTPIQETD